MPKKTINSKSSRFFRSRCIETIKRQFASQKRTTFLVITARYIFCVQITPIQVWQRIKIKVKKNSKQVYLYACNWHSARSPVRIRRWRVWQQRPSEWRRTTEGRGYKYRKELLDGAETQRKKERETKRWHLWSHIRKRERKKIREGKE